MKKSIGILAALLLATVLSVAQEVTTRGKVVSTTSGQAIPGASVIIKGTTKGTSTNSKGEFSILSPKNATIVISFIGMKSYEFTASGQFINVQLEELASTMDEVVVVGYGVQKKALITGANLNLKGEAIAKLNTGNAIDALQGIAPGVNITRNNGAPGAGSKVTIRGMGTIGAAEPLYIVDGVAVGNIDYLSPNDIESIDVLKDAASAAIYGSRAANGVILVGTKKAKEGTRMSVSYETYVGVQNIYKTVPTLNAQEYMFIMDEGRVNDGLQPYNWEQRLQNNPWLNSNFPNQLGAQFGKDIWSKLQNGWKGTRWIDEMSRKNAPVQNHALNIMGASQDITYSLGFSYYDQSGILGGDLINAGYKRLTGRLNTEAVLFKNSEHSIIKIGENLTYTNSENRSVAAGDIYYNDLHNAIVQSPLSPAYWDKSPDPNKFAPTLEGIHLEQYNSLALMYYRNNFNNNKSNSITGNIYAELQPIKNLKIRSSFGFNGWFGNSRMWLPKFALGTSNASPNDGAQQELYQGAEYTFTNTISYEKQLGKNKLTAMVGHEALKNVIAVNVGGKKANTNFGTPEFAYLDNVKKDKITGIDAWGKDVYAQGGGLLSYIGRLSYNYNEKYMVDLVYRTDGSSNFAKGRRWGVFPSASAAWIFTNEEFFKKFDFITFGKIRFSWGQNGNQAIPNFIYTSNIAYIEPGYYFGDNKPVSETTSIPDNISNPRVTWEVSEQTNLGIDLRMFSSRLSFTFDWYQKFTKNWLVVAPTLGTAGANPPYINGGDIRNRGYELSLGWYNSHGDFSYNATLTGSFNENKVTRISNSEQLITGSTNVLSQGTSYVSRVEVGRPIGYFYGFKTDGILQNQKEVDSYVGPSGKPYFDDQRPGDVRFVDLNKDGVIDEKDKTMIGNPTPKLELGFQLNLEYKGAYLSTTLAGKFGMQVMQSYRSFADRFDQNYTTEIFGRWHGEGTSNRLPRLTSNPSRNTNFISDLYVYNADFLRINNLTIGYNFEKLVSKLSWFNGAKLYVAANNLYTFTSYNGMDPDVRYGGKDNWASGIDLGLYPQPRTFMLGLNLTF